MEDAKALAPQLLSNRCDPSFFGFKTTAEIPKKLTFIGQKRAYEAIKFGISIKQDGYNLYALGPEELGKQVIVETILEAEAANKPVPSDWCYVYNFVDPRCPLALELPPGMGNKLKSQMEKLIENLKSSIPAVYDTEEHQARINQIQEETNAKQKEYFDSLQAEAEKNGMTILTTSKGFVVVPIKGGKVLTAKDLQELSEKERQEKEEKTEELNEDLAHVINEIQKLQKDRRKLERDYEYEFTLDAIKKPFSRIRKKFQKYSEVLEYLDEVENDIASNPKAFLKTHEEPTSFMWGESHPSEFAFSRYAVNVIVDNSRQKGAPIVVEDNPRYYKLFGRIEHVSQFGALVTDFTLIRSGSLHSANGGYLIIHVGEIIDQNWAWEALKRALVAKEIKIELPPSSISVTSTSTLEPEPIPLDIKVVLLGTRIDYYMLRDTDSKFNDLFKIAVDFEEEMSRNEDALELYAYLIANQVQQKKLRHLDSKALARVIEHCSRLVEDSEKLSLNMREITNLLEEANHWAEQSNRKVISHEDVQKAIDFQLYRLNHYQQIVYEEIQREITLIKTQGEVISQVNGLTTFRLGDFTFGVPSRITATARVGRDGIIDIDREVDLSGPIHSKGVLILSGFLRGRYVPDLPLTLSASMVFEQSYTPVDGDSASVAEICALLSALANLPIRQNFAVTGSVNQLGMVQAVGCVNEKIEGFFDICSRRGLTGNQGVLIPNSNVKSLMLRADVVQAAKEGKFHIYAIETVDQAAALLMATPAGTRDKDGNYSIGTINYMVEKKLEEFAKSHRKWIREGW